MSLTEYAKDKLKYAVIYTKKKPEIYNRLDKEFGISKNDGIIITYGQTVYCKYDLPEHLKTHEKTHIIQQRHMGVEEWWNIYIANKSFRLNQELEAYRNQVKYLKEHTEEMTRNERKGWFKKIATDLSGHIYGNMISYDEAYKAIME